VAGHGAGAGDRPAYAAAAERGDWAGVLTLIGEGDVAPDALELRASALYAIGRFEEAVGTWEQLHMRWLAADDRPEAARAAAMVAMYLMMDTGLMAPVRGWLRRADRLTDGDGHSPADALIALVRTYERLLSGDVDGARTQAARSVELGQRLGVLPAVVIGRVAGARIRIFDGDLQGGIEDLDEVAVLLMTGDVDPLTTGMMYCELICAAQGLALYDRSVEWTELMTRWGPGHAVGGIGGRCRVHRAEMLRMSGPCDRAEEEALAACAELRPWMRREFGWPLVELGTIRLRRGDLEGAEEAFLEADRHVWSPHPGLALLRLEQGDAATAVELIAEAIAHPSDIPSKERPPFGDLRLAPLLDAQAEIAAAAGDAATAGVAADALDAIAQRYPSAGLRSSAHLAAARAALASGDTEGAVERAGLAVAGWAQLGAPFEAAVSRTVLGEAHACAGRATLAQQERRAARDAFEAFGARRRAEAVGRLLEGVEPAGAPGRAPAEQVAVFRRTGDHRIVRYGDREVVVRDLIGHRYLERLLADPGRERHAIDLVALEHGTVRPAAGGGVPTEASGTGRQSGLPLLDDQAREAYRRRLLDIDEDIDDATRMHDLARLELARRDRDYLIAELARAVGLGGRARSFGDEGERARTSVTRSIRYALTKLAEHHPDLASHLERRVSTGVYCCYSPDPLLPIRWEL
jgi:tetratricopeptide (TPR) repeat protein